MNSADEFLVLEKAAKDQDRAKVKEQAAANEAAIRTK